MVNSKSVRVAMEQECRLAEHYFSKGEVSLALPHFRRTLLIDPESFKCGLRVAQCLDRTGRFGEAYDSLLHIMERGIARSEESIQREILQAFTNLCHKLGKELEVIDCLKSHLALAEATPALFYNLGLAFYKCNRFSEAQESFSRLKALHPRHSAGYIGQAILYCHLSQYDQAVRELRTGRAAAPRDAQIIENLAVVQMKMGNPLAAVTTLRQAFRQGSVYNAKFYHLMGMAHLRLGELGHAEGFLRKSLDLERSGEALREMGWLLVAKGNYPESISFLKEALTINPNDVWAKVDLAIAYFKQGITADAQILFNEARAASSAPEINRLLDDLARVIAEEPGK